MSMTTTQAQNYWKANVKLLNELEAYASETSLVNYRALWDAAALLNIGETQVAGSSSLTGHRSSFSGMLSPNAVASLMSSPLAEYCGALAITEGVRITLDQAIFRLREKLIASGDSIKTRGIVFGTPAAGGSNVGNGTIYRLTQDEDGFPLESGHPEVKSLLCRLDQQQVDRHEEVFDISGAEREPDFLLVSGTGPQGGISSIGPRASDRILLNQSFSSFSGSISGADVPVVTVNDFSGWTLGSITGAYASLTAFRDRAGEADSRKISVRWDNDNSFTQYLGRTRRPRFADRTPYLIGVRIYKDALVTAGSVTITVGASTVTVTLASLATGWNTVILPMDKRVYSKNFTQNDLKMQIILAGLVTTGTGIKVDDVTFTEENFVDGTFLTLLGGNTSFIKGDKFTITDTMNISGEGLLSKWTNHRSGILVSSSPGFCLPATVAPTILDPT